MQKLFALILAAVIVAPVVFLLLIVGTLINGYTLHLLWLWFMVPIAHLPALTVGQAIAIYMVVGFVTAQYQPRPKETKEDEWKDALSFALLRPLCILLMAQVVRNFI